MEPTRLHRAYTLVELLVVTAIIGLLSLVAITGQSSFNKTLVLANTAFDIALTIRSAEGYGIASRAAGATLNAGYGVHFDRSTPSSFKLFADTWGGPACATPDCKPGDHLFTAGQDVLIQTYTLGNGIQISDFCAIGGTSVCASGTLTSLDVSFTRPNPDTYVYGGVTQYNSACLKVTSPQGTSRYVSIGPSGLILANASSCP